MNFFRNILITFFLWLSIFLGANLSYADETGTVSGNINTSIDENSSQSDAKIKQDIQAYIIESYKAQ